ncbi:MAG: hypothetical protein IIA19_03920 [Thaumarchaeota archaeon]|nr:hypothetical protein [Nitrososphaerota archaeon]
MDLEKFRNDVYAVTDRLSSKLTEEDLSKLNFVRQQLIVMYQKNLVKINHSILELICAADLIANGYSVEAEKQITDILVCDLFAQKGDGDTIIEIETGFTPPDHALDTIDYSTARIMSKIARYSKHCSKFSLATPATGIIPIPKIFLIPPNARKKENIKKVQDLCDRYYKNPPINYDDILNARLHSIYLINVDKNFVKDLDPQGYVDLTEKILDRSQIRY